MTFGHAPTGLLLSSLGLSAANATTGGGGLDLLGVAAVITAVSGLIATVGALLIGLRKKDANNDALAQVLLKLADREKKDKP